MNIRDTITQFITESSLTEKKDILVELTEMLSSPCDLNGRNDQDRSPLIAAAYFERPELIGLLIQHGADIHFPDSQGNTPLHIAVDIALDGAIQNNDEHVDTATIEALLSQGADPQRKNKKGETPLDWARQYEDEEVVDLLNGK